MEDLPYEELFGCLTTTQQNDLTLLADAHHLLVARHEALSNTDPETAELGAAFLTIIAFGFLALAEETHQTEVAMSVMSKTAFEIFHMSLSENPEAIRKIANVDPTFADTLSAIRTYTATGTLPNHWKQA